jgi:hypothetical protein
VTREIIIIIIIIIILTTIIIITLSVIYGNNTPKCMLYVAMLSWSCP